MAITTNILFQHASGTIGDVVFRQMKGKTFMQRKPGPRKGESTPNQQTQQARFSLMIQFLKPLRSLITQTFSKSAVKMSAFNAAFRHNIQHAIKGKYPDYSIDPVGLSLSTGKLQTALGPEVSSTVVGQLSFTWKIAEYSTNGNAAHRSALFVYWPAGKQVLYKLNGPMRFMGKAVMDLTSLCGETVHTYIAFRDDAGNFSRSAYVGEVKIMEELRKVRIKGRRVGRR